MSESLYPWLVLAMTPYLGGHRINKLLRHVSAQECVGSSFEQLCQLGLTHQQATAITSPNQQRIDQALRWQQHPDQHILTLDSPAYTRDH